MSEIDPRLKGTIECMKSWFEEQLKNHFSTLKFGYEIFEQHQIPTQRKLRCQPFRNTEAKDSLNDVNIAFLTGGTCRIPHIQKWIKEQFPKAEVIMGGELEIITATGAAIHGLQVQNGEVEPYISILRSIACSIEEFNFDRTVYVYNIRTKEKLSYPPSIDQTIQEIINELVEKYGENMGNIVIDEYSLVFRKKEELRNYNSKKYGKLLHIATEKELNFEYYLTSKVEYSVGDRIVWFEHLRDVLYECIEATEGRITQRKIDERKYNYRERVDLEHIKRIFHINANQVHLVFEHNEEKIYSYDSNLHKHGFKSINFAKSVHRDSLILSRCLLRDTEVSILVEISSPEEKNLENFTIEDHGFICIPQLIKEYKPKTDIMGVDLGSTRSVLAVSRNREIQIIPFDISSPGDLWTESVVSFDGKKPLIGIAAVKRLKNKHDYVLFDTKLLYNNYHRKEDSIWAFKFSLNKDEQPYVESDTCDGLKEFSHAEFNKIFLERMSETASEYQSNFNNGERVKRAVITIPQYFYKNKNSFLISSIIEAANLAKIEIIDIIEETHADLLYYLSNEQYSKTIKPGVKIAIFDIGGGTCICKVCEISEHKGKKYATRFIESYSFDGKNDQYSGRSIDDIFIKELEKSIPKEKINEITTKLKMLEAAKKVKCDLSIEKQSE